jgi:hypothetical protein
MLFREIIAVYCEKHARRTEQLGLDSRLAFGRPSLRILAGTPDILVEIFVVFVTPSRQIPW